VKRKWSKTSRKKTAKRNAKARKLEAKLEELRKENAELKAKIEDLIRQLALAKKDSSTSSKSPSSDIVKPPRAGKAKGKKLKIGGQPGHPLNERIPFSPDQIDHAHPLRFDCCPDCGAGLCLGKEPPKTFQQVELAKKLVEIHEYQSHSQWCPKCKKVVFAPFPEEITAAGLSGPGLTALVVYLKGACHASFSTIRKFFRDVVKLSFSRGYLRKLVNKASVAMEAPYQELLRALPLELKLNVDETGHKENGEKYWTWCFRAQLYTLFRIDKSRGSDVLVEVLGKEFDGVIGCDYFSAYRKYMGDFDVRVQFCLAHLIRDIKFIEKLDKVSQNFGKRILAKIRSLFQVIHRRESMIPETFQAKLEKARDAILKSVKRPPPRLEALNIAERFRNHGKAYFEFITTPGIDPTNNLAEQAIRFVVIDRKVTQGTRSLSGRQWCERIWTAMATCTQQGRSVFNFIFETITAFFQGRPAPSLLSNTS